MSCTACKMAQENDYSFYYRWGNANIEIRGCSEHVGQIIKVLNEYKEND